MKPLTSSQRKRLRGLAHELKPLVHLGKAGLTDAALAQIDKELADHELIKVKFVEFKEAKKEIAAEIAQATKSELVGLIGNIAILYRQHPDPEKRKIHVA